MFVRGSRAAVGDEVTSAKSVLLGDLPGGDHLGAGAGAGAGASAVPADYVPGRLLQDQHGRSVSSTLS